MSTITAVKQRLVGTAELLDLFKVGRTRLYALAAREDFPAPVVVLRMGSIWDLDQIIAWAESTGRTLHLETLTPVVPAGEDS